jgi:hypothetical protein
MCLIIITCTYLLQQLQVLRKKKKKLSVALTGENVHKMQLKPSGYTYTFTL